MSPTDRILEALRSAILLEARVSGLASHVAQLAHDVREVDRRLVRVETMIELNQGGATARKRLPRPEHER